jgi:hypothetical protein
MVTITILFSVKCNTMGNQVSLIPKVSYEDIQMVVYRNMHVQHSTLIINTLPPSLQHCLIKTTLDIRFEERIVNTFIEKKPDIMIIVYGKNSNDITILHKYEQLVKLGFTNVYIYTGGIFEWMLLHEMYGKDLFQITKHEIDILRYRPKSVLLGAMAGGGRSIDNDYNGNTDRYIESTEIMNDPLEDVRINIPNMNANDDNHGKNILTTGLQWLFGSSS